MAFFFNFPAGASFLEKCFCYAISSSIFFITRFHSLCWKWMLIPLFWLALWRKIAPICGVNYKCNFHGSSFLNAFCPCSAAPEKGKVQGELNFWRHKRIYLSKFHPLHCQSRIWKLRARSRRKKLFVIVNAELIWICSRQLSEATRYSKRTGSGYSFSDLLLWGNS